MARNGFSLLLSTALLVTGGAFLNTSVAAESTVEAARTKQRTPFIQVTRQRTDVQSKTSGGVVANDKTKRTILHSWDGCSMWETILKGENRVITPPKAEFSQRMLEEMIDEEAAAHVDAIAYCLFTAFWSDLPASRITDLFPWRPAVRPEMPPPTTTTRRLELLFFIG